MGYIEEHWHEITGMTPEDLTREPDEAQAPQLATPILDKLSKASVFSVWYDKGDAEVEFQEECDKWYTCVLTKAELLALSDELRLIADQLTDEA